MTTTSLHDFRLSAISHLAAANRILETNDATTAGRTPATAAYLAGLSLECLLKARILLRGGVESVEKLREKQSAVYKALFTSAKGHDLNNLAGNLRLDALLASEGTKAPKAEIWERLSHAQRPYSLRYGSEQLSSADATAEVAEVSRLHAPLLAGLKVGYKATKPKKNR